MSRSFLGLAVSALVMLAPIGPSAAQGIATPTGSETLRVAQAQPAEDAKPARRSRKKSGAEKGEGSAAATESSTKKEPTAGQMAARERQRKCGAEWKEAKAAGKTGGLKWPKFWSQCNARLKGKTV